MRLNRVLVHSYYYLCELVRHFILLQRQVNVLPKPGKNTTKKLSIMRRPIIGDVGFTTLRGVSGQLIQSLCQQAQLLF